MKKILKPNKIIGLSICLIATLLLIYVFNNRLENTFIGYFSYPFSTYGLIILIQYINDLFKYLSKRIKNNNIYKLYKDNYSIFYKYQTIISFLISLIYFLIKTYLGIKSNSNWLITLGIYYLVLCFIKFVFIKNYKNIDKEISNECKILKIVGFVLLFLNLILVLMIIQIIAYDKTFTYYFYLIFAMALYDFIIIIISFKNVIKDRKNNNPIIITKNNISLATAMVSMLSLETSMIYTFGNNDYAFKRKATAIFGAVMILINTLNSINMIIKANKKA